MNQGSPLNSIDVSLNGVSYPLKDDGKDGDKLKGDNTWSVRLITQKQEKLQLHFDDGEKWKDSISVNCSDKSVQNIQIIRMTDNFLLYDNEENPNKSVPQPADSKPMASSNPTTEDVSTAQERTFSEIPDSNEGDIYLLILFIGGLLLTFFIQIYLRWKRDIQPTLEELQNYIHSSENKMKHENERQETKSDKVEPVDSEPDVNLNQIKQGTSDETE